MAEDAGIVITAKDNYSSTIVKVNTATKSFSKDVTGLAQKLDLLNNTKASINVNFTKAKNEIAAANKVLKSAKEGTDEFAEAMRRAQAAQSDFNNLQSQLQIIGSESKNAANNVDNLEHSISKTQNRAGGIMGTAGMAAAAQYVGGIATQGLSTFAKSATGNIGGMYVDSAIGGATSGAAIGTMIAPGIGTAIGALAGGALGLVQGQMKEFEMKDDAFRSSVQGLYEASTGKVASNLQAGTGIAAGRETDLISFGTLFKDKGKAKDFLGGIKDMANETPFLYDDLTGMAKVLKANGFEESSLIPTMTSIGDAGAALGMNQGDMQMVATALGRMTTSNKASTEYLNIMLERGIPVYDYMAEAGGVSKAEIMSMISKGDVSGADAAQSIIDYLGAEFKGSMLEQSKTYTGLQSTVLGLSQELQNAQGAGYDESRKNSLTEQAKWLGGSQGNDLQGMYSEIGKWQADLENQKDAIYRYTMDRMRETEEYTTAKSEGDGATLYKLLTSAEAKAETEWTKTAAYAEAKEANLGIIDNIQKSTEGAENYYNDSLIYQNKLSEGVASVNAKLNAGTQQPKNYLNMNWLTGNENNSDIGISGSGAGRRKTFAWGLDRVPHDNYPAMLHEGERVLTANQTRQQGNTGSVLINMGGVTVRENADIDRIASELVRRLQLAQMIAN